MLAWSLTQSVTQMQHPRDALVSFRITRFAPHYLASPPLPQVRINIRTSQPPNV
jgi:hypothetical protein